MGPGLICLLFPASLSFSPRACTLLSRESFFLRLQYAIKGLMLQYMRRHN